jgi:hypothetical protein
MKEVTVLSTIQLDEVWQYPWRFTNLSHTSITNHQKLEEMIVRETFWWSRRWRRS